MQQLRDYQSAAVSAALKCLQSPIAINPCLEIPTGGGKTPIIATLARVIAQAGARVLIVAHRKELIEQTAEKLTTWADGVPFSIVSAGLGQKDYGGRVVVAGIQSVYKHADLLTANGQRPINFLIVDEAHLIPNTDSGADGMYQTLIRNLTAYYPALRVVGLTATPYRLGTGTVVGDDKILNSIVYKIGVKELIDRGFLSPLRSRLPELDVDKNNIRIERGEYKTADLEAEYGQRAVVFKAVENLVAMTRQRNSVLVFCCGVEHAKQITDELRKQQNAAVALVTGETPADERAETLRRFKGDLHADLIGGGKETAIKYLVNVDVLTTGFDATNVDCVVLLRPTMSPGLYYQMVGRGFRLHPGKKDCLVLDFAGNIETHGPVDQLAGTEENKGGGRAPVKKCPRCWSLIAANAKTCPDCGAVIVNDDFECPSCHGLNDRRANFCMLCGYQLRDIAKHDITATTTSEIISGEGIPLQTEKIVSVQYSKHLSKKSGKNSLRVDYETDMGTRLSEFVCFEHEGFAYQKALKWWAARTTITPAPSSVAQAYDLADGGYIGKPTELTYSPKKPGDYGPELKSVKVERLEIGTKPYPRTDNPLAIACQICGGGSWLYETDGVNYTIKCAKCGEVYGIFNSENCDGTEGLRGELDSLRRSGIEFYDPNAKYGTFDDFDTDNDTAELKDFAQVFGGTAYGGDLDDLPF